MVQNLNPTKTIAGRVGLNFYKEITSYGLNLSEEVEKSIMGSLLTKEYYNKKKKELQEEIIKIENTLKRIDLDTEKEISKISKEKKERINRIFKNCSKKVAYKIYVEDINPDISFSIFSEIYSRGELK